MTHLDSQTWLEFQKQRKNKKPEDGEKKQLTQNWNFFCGIWSIIIFIFSLYNFFSLLKSSLYATYRSNPCSVVLQTKTVVEELCRAREQEVGGQRSCTAKLSRKQGKEVYFSRQVEPTAAQKAVTPPISNYGCDSDKAATWNYTSTKIF